MLSNFHISIENNFNLKILDPVGYHDSICLTANSLFVLTDSGGLQEETTFLKTPCLTLRPNTERPITISVGSNKLTGLDRLWEDIRLVLNKSNRAGSIPPLWDGKTAERIVKVFSELDKSE